MLQYALVTEGITDSAIINQILYGYFKYSDPKPTRLLPKDAELSNWSKVIDYCKSDELKAALNFNDVIIIQIDSDVFFSPNVPKEYSLDQNLIIDTNQTIERVKEFLIEAIGQDFYNNNAERFVFAISVHSIECWLLPIFFQTNQKKAAKTTGCLGELNTLLNKKFGFTIDKANKEYKYYAEIVENKQFRKAISGIYLLNPSLAAFINELEAKQTFDH